MILPEVLLIVVPLCPESSSKIIIPPRSSHRAPFLPHDRPDSTASESAPVVLAWSTGLGRLGRGIQWGKHFPRQGNSGELLR